MTPELDSHSFDVCKINVLLSLLVVRVAGVSQPAGVVDLDVGADGGHVGAVAGGEDGLLPAHVDAVSEVNVKGVYFGDENVESVTKEREGKKER